ncbi:MAG: Mur ligase domain-containing protein, partial [bacterium]|nr:Mur ligase domain-containing protein [bacterium]
MPVQKLKIHFIGIGGIGVSALAKYYIEKGHKVSGSDLVRSEITDALKKTDAKISIGENKVPENTNLVIYSPAVKIKNLKLKIPTLSYPQALGELTKQHYTIAVSGTHGKSTTTSML